MDIHERTGSNLCGSAWCGVHAGIPEEGHAGDSGNRLLEQLEPLAIEDRYADQSGVRLREWHASSCSHPRYLGTTPVEFPYTARSTTNFKFSN